MSVSDYTYIEIAKEISLCSKAKRAKVGAILVKDGTIIAMGYNGTPTGFNNTCEVDNVTKSEVIHAESNAIVKCATSTISSEGSTLYCTMLPCFDCAKLIIQAKIKRVVYHLEYRKQNGKNLLNKAGISCIKLEKK